MKRFLRRVGGIKRLFFGALAFLAVFYVAQTFMSNGSPHGNEGVKSHVDSVEPINASSLVDSNDVTNNNAAENKASLCDVDAVCPSSTLVFTVRSLSNNDDNDQKRPQFCVNGQIISSMPNAPKTVSVVVFAEAKRAVDELKHFDVSVDDKELRDFLIRLPFRSVVFLSSAGNVELKIKEETRSVLRTQFGARNDTSNAATSFVFIGQKGLKPGLASEKSRADTTDVELRGCLQIPMGEMDVSVPSIAGALTPSMKSGQVARRDSIVYGQILANCGLGRPCPSDQFSVAVYSGKNKDDEPKICVNGQMIMSRQLNKAGRGLNLVVLNATTKQILRVGHFDTYAEESKSFEVFLEEMIYGEMIVVVSFDEASTHFSATLKQLFYELGSALVQNLKFRASWFLVGQKGITGFSPFEELNFANGNDWAKPIDKQFCVPPFLDGMRVRPDPIVLPQNIAKRHFCEKYDGYEEFCEDSHMDDPIAPAALTNRSLNGNPIYKVPILVVSGLSHNSLRLCLETLIRQPGIDPKFILVTYDENYAESGELANLFEVKSKAVSSSASYTTQLAKSLGVVWEQFTDADVAIVIEEELMVTADFLYFMAQMYPLLRSDQTVTSVSAWNINGFNDTATLPNLVYRVQDFPGLAFMLRKTTYVKYMQGKMDECCNKRAWDGWQVEVDGRLPVTIIPDVSRVIRRHIDVNGDVDRDIEDMFHQPRAYSKMADSWISNSKLVDSEGNYDAHLRSMMLSATPVDAATIVKQCEHSRTSLLSLLQSFSASTSNPSDEPAKTTGGYVLYYEESNESLGVGFLARLRRCFGLYYSSVGDRPEPPVSKANDSSPDIHFSTHRGFYKGVLRFSYLGRMIFLIGPRSPFFAELKKTTAPTANTGILET